MDNKTDYGVDLDNLKLDTSEMSWDTKPSRDSREIGSKIIANSDPDSKPVQSKKTEQSQISSETVASEQLENFLPTSVLETPSKPKDTAVAEAALDIPFDKSAFKTTDKLDQTGVAAIDNAVEKLNQDGDIASFYDTARQMMEANLDNSYNRKIGEGIK